VKCDNIIDELTSYLDNALDPALKQELEEHLKKCKKCRLVVDTCKKTIQIYCNSEPVQLPDETRLRLHTALRERLQQMRR
jgi:anti-sigma factor RsiW